jgi:endonuclease III-like uncharacterized protein
VIIKVHEALIQDIAKNAHLALNKITPLSHVDIKTSNRTAFFCQSRSKVLTTTNRQNRFFEFTRETMLRKDLESLDTIGARTRDLPHSRRTS